MIKGFHKLNVRNNKIILVDAWTEHYSIEELARVGWLLLLNKVVDQVVLSVLFVLVRVRLDQFDRAAVFTRYLNRIVLDSLQKNLETLSCLLFLVELLRVRLWQRVLLLIRFFGNILLDQANRNDLFAFSSRKLYLLVSRQVVFKFNGIEWVALVWDHGLSLDHAADLSVGALEPVDDNVNSFCISGCNHLGQLKAKFSREIFIENRDFALGVIAK